MGDIREKIQGILIMKSVIAQGATVAKAVEEAVKKAGNPKEFFIKILQEAQGGFLGFGSTKAKIALFFKKEDFARRGSDVLSQDTYKDLFDNKSLQRQVDSQEKDSASQKDGSSSMQTRRIEKRPAGTRSRMRRRTIGTGQHKARPRNTDQVDEKSQQSSEEPRSAVNRKRTSYSPRRPRQGSRWGNNKDESRKKEDKDNS